MAQPVEPGLISDLRKASTTILQDPPDAHSFIAHSIVDGAAASEASCRVVRMNPLIQGHRQPDGLWTRLPDFNDAQFERLVAMDMDAIESGEVHLIDRLCSAWLADKVANQPVRATRQGLCDIGHPSFATALKAWRQLAH